MTRPTRSLAAALAAAAALLIVPTAQAAIVTDSFTGTDGTLLENHTGEVGATWTWHPNYGADLKLQSGRVWGTEWGLYFPSGIPSTNDYDVSAQLHVKSNAGAIGVVARSSTSGSDNLYMGRYNATGARWELVKCSTSVGGCTNLATFSQTLAIGSTYSLKLEIRDATKKLYVDGVERASSTDDEITQVGRPGIRSGPGVTTATTGYHLDNFSVDPPPSTETTIGSGPSGPTASTSASFTYSSTPSGGTFECRLDTPSGTGTWASCPSTGQSYSSLAQGAHTFNVRATVAGQTDPTPATRSWTVDTVAPNTTIQSGPSGTITVNSATFTYTSSEPTGATYQCRLDTPSGTGSWTACNSGTQSYSGLANGAHTFNVRASDAAGNQDSTADTRAFTVSVSGGPPAYTVTFQDSFEGATFPQVFATGAWNSGKLFAGTGAYFNQITPSGYSAVDGTKVAESGLTTTSQRSEIQCHRASDYGPDNLCAGFEGSEFVYEWSFRIPTTVTVPNQPHPNRPNILQTKPHVSACYGGGMVIWPSTDSTKFELRQTIRGGSITDATGSCVLATADTTYFLGTFDKGSWHRVVMHAKWSTSSSTGFMEMWIDGTQVMPLQTRPTLILDSPANKQMFRLGIYNSINASNWNVQYDHVKIGIP